MIILILETLCDVVYECMLDSTVKLQIYQFLSYEPQLNASAGGVARLYSIRFDYSPRLPPCPVAICVLTYNVRADQWRNLVTHRQYGIFLHLFAGMNSCRLVR